MRTIWRGILPGFCLVWGAFHVAAQEMPKTTKEHIKESEHVKTEQLKGTVLAVDGSHLAVKMANGELRSFNVPASRKFDIDGKEVSVGDLKPGTKLTATITTTTTQINERTTTVGSGKVWLVLGNTVIVTLPNNENRMYNVSESYKFMVDGREATLRDLKPGMTISAQKIVEAPRTEIATNTVVHGEAPTAGADRVKK